MPENLKTKDFRHVFSNTFSMQFNDNDVQITFGHVLDAADLAKGMIEEVSVFITPRSAKIMMLSLKSAIERFEQAVGMPIPLPPGKMEEIEKAAALVQAAKPST
jgi:acetyl/propionyl-CoA carboxylase alpha subunit